MRDLPENGRKQGRWWLFFGCRRKYPCRKTHSRSRLSQATKINLQGRRRTTGKREKEKWCTEIEGKQLCRSPEETPVAGKRGNTPVRLSRDSSEHGAAELHRRSLGASEVGSKVDQEERRSRVFLVWVAKRERDEREVVFKTRWMLPV